MAKQLQECLGFFEEDTECLGDPKAEKKVNRMPCADLEDCKKVKAVAEHRGTKPEALLKEYSLDRIREIHEQEVEGKGKGKKGKEKPAPKEKPKAKAKVKEKPAPKAKKEKAEAPEKSGRGKSNKPRVAKELTIERFEYKAQRMLQPSTKEDRGVKVRNDGNDKYSVAERATNPWRQGSDWFFTFEAFRMGGTLHQIAKRALGMAKAHMSE